MLFTIRHYSRFAVKCPVSYFSDPFHGAGTVWNFSLTGWRPSGTC